MNDGSDDDLFEGLMNREGVRPLRRQPTAPKKAPAPSGPATRVAEKSEKNASSSLQRPLPPLFAPQLPEEEPLIRPDPRATFILEHDSAELCAGRQPNLDSKRFRDLANGNIRPSARLDLHRLLMEEAFEICAAFLHRAQADGHKCVLVIPGKGRGAGMDGDRGILHFQLPQWLSGHPAVMAYHTARPSDGGAGAFYVLLKKLRKEETYD